LFPFWIIITWLGFFLMLSSAVFSIPWNSLNVLSKPFHLKVQDKRLIDRWERQENNISSQVRVKFKTKSVQSLNVTNHFDHMRTNRATFC
jgi:hypothetical protein